MRLAIADPPYPPFVGSGGVKNRATRWYGDGQRSTTDRPSDCHDAAHEWNDPARHRRLLLDLLDEYDGFAIATTPDGMSAYGDLPAAMRIMVWIKPNAQPGSHRLRSLWEPVLLYPPAGRRSNRNGIGMVPDVLTARAPRCGFIGAKPPEWTRWVLDALSYVPRVARSGGPAAPLAWSGGVVIVLALLALWLVTLTPFVILAYGQGRDDERHRHNQQARLAAAAVRSEQTPR